MTQKMIITRGLPGSGKSTWAKKVVAQNSEYIRVERDLLRDQLFGNRIYTKPADWTMTDEEFKNYFNMRENLVTKVQTSMVISALDSGKSVIISDTNLRAQHVRAWAKLAASKGVQFEQKIFTASLETLYERDEIRLNNGSGHGVGEEVISRMWKQNTKNGKIEEVDVSKEMDASFVIEPYVENPDLPWAVIADIDGTLAKMANRSPYEWHRVGEDEPVAAVVAAVDAAYLAGDAIIVMSGRDGSCRQITEDWLDVAVDWDELHMRTEGDNRKDDIVKYELFNKNIRGKYNVRYVLDDRDQVVAMWRKLGLACFQVNYGDF